jgi:hypothetical protein
MEMTRGFLLTIPAIEPSFIPNQIQIQRSKEKNMSNRLLICLGLTCICAFSGWSANMAGVVIRNSTGELITRCIEFEEPSLSVEELMQRSGFKAVTHGTAAGPEFCYIHDDGATDCSVEPDGLVWRLWVRDSQGWTLSPTNMSATVLSNGEVFGYVYSEQPVAPPDLGYQEICGVLSRAGLVIDHHDGTRHIQIVEFHGETITALQLLQKSSLEVVTNQTSFGTAICAINGEGQPANDCFGDPDGRYWGFNRLLQDDSWTFSPVGVSETIVYDSDVLGFFFGAFGEQQPGVTREEVLQSTSHVGWFELY